VAPAPGGPAERAGIKAQDRILAVSGVPTEGKSLYDVAAMLQGPPQSSVILTLVPRDASNSKDVKLTR
jgi:carboxyl-terminal processing protease